MTTDTERTTSASRLTNTREGTMSSRTAGSFQRWASLGAAAVAALLTCTSPAQARVTKLVIDTTVSPAFGGATFGDVGQYETITGRVFGELDPRDPRHRIIN